jgi:hypothetical protein
MTRLLHASITSYKLFIYDFTQIVLEIGINNYIASYVGSDSCCHKGDN